MPVPEVEPLPAALAERRILVVEDHPTNQVLMQWRLQQLGMAHELAEDGEQALAKLASTGYHLVITDCRMPVMDGYQMTRRLRERERDSGATRVPVIALTASTLDADVQRCREAGMDDVLAKPVALATLRQILLRWLPGGSDGSDGSVDAAAPVPAALPGALPGRAAIEARFGSGHVAQVLIDSMREATEADLLRGRSAVQAQDAAVLTDVLHRIAGGLGTLGADALAVQAQALMAQVKEVGTPAVEASLAAFERQLRDYLQALQAQ